MTEVYVIKNKEQWYHDGFHGDVNDPYQHFYPELNENDEPNEFPCLLISTQHERYGDFEYDNKTIPLKELGLTLPE